jgi:hypothetical protein
MKEKQLFNLIKKIISEQGAGPWFGPGPGPGVKKKTVVQKSLVIPGNLFPTGSDKVTEDSEAFLQASKSIKNALVKTKNLNVTIVGGASIAVNPNFKGDPVKFNTELALRRANNFSKVLERNFQNVSFSIGKPKVDTNAKVLNSKEALNAQNVTLYFTTQDEESYVTQAVDKTAVVRRPNQGYYDKKRQELINYDPYIVCFEIDKSKLNDALTILKTIKGAHTIKAEKKKNK